MIVRINIKLMQVRKFYSMNFLCLNTLNFVHSLCCMILRYRFPLLCTLCCAVKMVDWTVVTACRVLLPKCAIRATPMMWQLLFRMLSATAGMLWKRGVAVRVQRRTNPFLQTPTLVFLHGKSSWKRETFTVVHITLWKSQIGLITKWISKECYWLLLVSSS